MGAVGLIAIISILQLIALCPATADDVDRGKVPLSVPKALSGILIDGVLDEEAWGNALVITLDYEVQPAENVPPPVRTECLITHNDTHLFIAFRAFDPEPGAIRAHLSDRDRLGSDDWCGVILDTFNDERRSFDFLATALGVQYDQIETQTGSDVGWDAIWDSSGRIHDWGYAIEMAIPFSSLRFQRGEGEQVWGFDAVRSYPRNVRHHIGAFPRNRNNNCYLCQAIKIKGFEGVTPGRNIEIDPTITAARTDERADFPGGDFQKRDQAAELGVTARWGVTPNMTFNATANPDFSQVEADALQLDINQPFALFFEEKRPFFTEGSDFFNTRMSAVYTRMMRDPSWGLKLTGKEGANTIGAYVVRDDITNLIFPGSQSSSAASLRQANTSSVFRYCRDFGSDYTLGALLTDREGGDYFNRVFGFDGNFRLSRMDRVQVQVLGSSTRYPGELAGNYGQPTGDFSDSALHVFYFHNTRSHDWYIAYEDIGPGFRADLGFIPQVDSRAYSLGWGHTWNAQPGSWWSMFNFGAGYDDIHDHQGNLLVSQGSFWFNYSGALQSGFDLNGIRRRQGYNGMEFDMTQVFFDAWFRPHGNIYLSLDAALGDQIDYANTRGGDRLRLTPSVVYNMGLHLKLAFDHSYEQMSVDEGRLYTANTSQLSAVYQFNVRSFFRAICQYVQYDYHAELYSFPTDEQYKRLFTQLLFSYKINPQTVLYLGYSDNYFGNQDFGITQADRTFFVKLGYAWVL